MYGGPDLFSKRSNSILSHIYLELLGSQPSFLTRKQISTEVFDALNEIGAGPRKHTVCIVRGQRSPFLTPPESHSLERELAVMYFTLVFQTAARLSSFGLLLQHAYALR